MDRDRYITLLRSDGARLADVAARDLDAAVPTCPGWTVRDAVMHTADVYQDKMTTIELRGGEPENPSPDRPEGMGALEWFGDTFRRLLTMFDTMDDDAPAATWWPSEGKAELWVRRMAQETTVHRYDVESAFGATTPIADDLAVDGVDEVLRIFLAHPWWHDHPRPALTGTIDVRTGGRTWHVEMVADAVTVADSGEGADVTVSGDPSPVLLWLWGRVGDDAVTIEGDAAVAKRLRERLVEAE